MLKTPKNLTKKDYAKKQYRQITRIGVIASDWANLIIKIKPTFDGTGYQLQINEKHPEQLGHIRTYKGNYKDLPEAQAEAVRELCKMSKMYALLA